jgi:hypothetical protein
MKTEIPSESAYRHNEAMALARQLNCIETASLADRRAARADWAEALHDPALVAERVRWLLDGSYGRGAYDRAWAIARASARSNKVAQLGQLIAALEWQCPAAFAAAAARRHCTVDQLRAVNAAIAVVLADALTESDQTHD